MVDFGPAPVISAHWVTSFRTLQLHDWAILASRCQWSIILGEHSTAGHVSHAARPHLSSSLSVTALIPSNLPATLLPG